MTSLILSLATAQAFDTNVYNGPRALGRTLRLDVARRLQQLLTELNDGFTKVGKISQQCSSAYKWFQKSTWRCSAI